MTCAAPASTGVPLARAASTSSTWRSTGARCSLLPASTNLTQESSGNLVLASLSAAAARADVVLSTTLCDAEAHPYQRVIISTLSLQRSHRVEKVEPEASWGGIHEPRNFMTLVNFLQVWCCS